MNSIPRIQTGPTQTHMSYRCTMGVSVCHVWAAHTGYKLFKFVASNSIENESKNLKFYDISSKRNVLAMCETKTKI
jgi:hypothetical protein